MLDERPRPVLRRLMTWLKPCAECVGHEAQRIALGQYLNGLLGDRARKSMPAMLARVTAPVRYQAFQPFVTDAPWDAATRWNGVRAWLMGAAWYLPEEWLKDRSRGEQARIPKAVVFQKQWELALGLLRDALAAGFDVAAVLAAAGDGDVAAFRAARHE